MVESGVAALFLRGCFLKLKKNYKMAYANKLTEFKVLASTNYTITPVDEDKTLKTIGSGNITIPPNSSVPFPLGTRFRILYYAAGQPTIVAGTGVTINTSASSLAIANRYDSITLEKIGTDEWMATFDKSGSAAAYKVYSILLTCATGVFTTKFLENTLGDSSGDGTNDVVWSVASSGLIRGAMTNAFTANKTAVYNGGLSQYIVSGTRPNVSFCQVRFELHDGTQTATPNFTDLPIEIRVYN